MPNTKPPKISPKQMAAIKHIVARAPNGTELLKKILFHMLDKSDLLSRRVHFIFEYGGEYGSKDEIWSHLHTLGSMNSSRGSTDLGVCMKVSGSKMMFSYHSGIYKPNKKLSENYLDGGATIWLGTCFYGNDGMHSAKLRVMKNSIESIDIGRPGLYPDLEKQDHWCVKPYKGHQKLKTRVF